MASVLNARTRTGATSGIFFLRQNTLSIPGELLDAARIDGASEFGVYWRIILPLTVSWRVGPAGDVNPASEFLEDLRG